MLQEKITCEELSQVVDAEQGLESAVHVACVAEVVQAGLGDRRCRYLLVFFVVVAVEGNGASSVVKGLVINFALVAAVDDLSTYTLDIEIGLFDAFFAISEYFVVLLVLLESLTNLNNKSICILEVTINILLSIFLSCYKSALNSVLLILDRFCQLLDDGVGGCIGKPLPNSYVVKSIFMFAVFLEESIQLLVAPEVG